MNTNIPPNSNSAASTSDLSKITVNIDILPHPVEAAPDTDTPAVAIGRCPSCYWTLFQDMPHHCPTNNSPLVVFNTIGIPRTHSNPEKDILRRPT